MVRLLLHAEKRKKRWPHGKRQAFQWQWCEYHLRRLPLKDVRVVSTRVPSAGVVRLYTDVIFTKTPCVQKQGEQTVERGVSVDIAFDVVCDKKRRVDLRVWVPWLRRRVLFSRLVAFHFWPIGIGWTEFNKLAPGKKNLRWVVDHLKPPKKFQDLVGKHWSRLVLSMYLEIITQKENVQRQHFHSQ